MPNKEFYILSGKPPAPIKVEERPQGYEQLAVADTAVGLASIPTNADKAVIVVEDATIRWRDDGTAPTATVGTKSFVNTTIILDGRQKLEQFEAIRQGSTSANLSINYYSTR